MSNQIGDKTNEIANPSSIRSKTMLPKIPPCLCTVEALLEFTVLSLFPDYLLVTFIMS